MKNRWPRASEKENDKVISEDARELEELVLDVDSYMGPGKVLLYESDRILVDPDRHQELLHNYEFEATVTLPSENKKIKLVALLLEMKYKHSDLFCQW